MPLSFCIRPASYSGHGSFDAVGDQVCCLRVLHLVPKLEDCLTNSIFNGSSATGVSQIVLSKSLVSSEQPFADSLGEHTASRKLGWQYMLAKKTKAIVFPLFHYQLAERLNTKIGISPST